MADKKKVIKFYASWCGPCKVYGKVWDKVVEEFSNNDSYEFIDVNVESDTTGLAAEYKVKSIPLTVLVENGTTTQKPGRLSQEELISLIK